MEVKIEVKDRNNVTAKLTAVTTSIRNPRKLHARFGVQGIKWVDENFKKQGGLLKEGKWKRLAYSTLEARRTRKERRTMSEKILKDRGKLRESFDTRFTHEGVWIGTVKKYAAPHEFGEPKRGLPQRRMLPRQQDDTMVERLKKTLRSYIREEGEGVFE